MMLELKITNFEIHGPADAPSTSYQPEDWKATVQVLNATWYGARSKQTRHAYAFSAYKPLFFSLQAPSGRLTMQLKLQTSTIPGGKLLKAKPVTIQRDQTEQLLVFQLQDGRTAKADVVLMSQQPTAPKRTFWQLLGLRRHKAATGSTTSSISGSDTAPTIVTDTSYTQEDMQRSKRRRSSQPEAHGLVGWLRRRRQPATDQADRYANPSLEAAVETQELAAPRSHDSIMRAMSADFHEIVPSKPISSATVPPAATAAPYSSWGQEPVPGQPANSAGSARVSGFTSVCTNPLFLEGLDGVEVNGLGDDEASSRPASRASNAQCAVTGRGGGAEGGEAAPIEDGEIEAALELLRALPAERQAEFEDAIRSAQQVVDHALGRALLDSCLQQITPYDKGMLDAACGWYVKVLHTRAPVAGPVALAAATRPQQAAGRKVQPSAQAAGQVSLRLTYADVDQMVLGAPHACTCISLLAARAVLGGEALCGERYAGIIREGAALWRTLCAADTPAGGPPSSFSTTSQQQQLLDFHTVLCSVPGCHEALEAHAQISAQGLGDAQTTLPECAASCMARPGAYVLTTAGHTTAAVVRADGSVQWANSLGTSLAPSCQSGYIAHFRDVSDFATAFSQLGRPTDGTPSVAVEVHQLSAAHASNVGFFTFFAQT